MVAINKRIQYNNKDIPLKGRVVLPFYWLWVQNQLRNVYLYKELKTMLEESRATVGIMAEFIAKIAHPWNELNYPLIAMYDVEKRETVAIEPYQGVVTFSKPPKEEGCLPNIIGLIEPLYVVKDGKWVCNLTAMEERSQNMVMYNHFIRNRYPIRMVNGLVIGTDIECGMPYIPDTTS